MDWGGDPEGAKPGHSLRGDIIDLHELHLIAGQRGSWQPLRDARKRMPHGEWYGEQDGLSAKPVRNHIEKLLVSIDTRTPKFVRDWLCRGRLHSARYGLGDILYVGGLQPCRASPKHRASWKSLQQLHEGIKESIVLPEHDRRANDDRICKGCLSCQFTFASVAYVM
jgi:hypothetical protein